VNFLQAHAIVKGFAGGPALPLLVGMSGTAEPLSVFLSAAAAQRGYDAALRFLPFNTLQQAIHEQGSDGEQECFVLMPWDLVPELDWRTGLSRTDLQESELQERARAVLRRLEERGAHIVYVPAPCPPLWLDPLRNASLLQWLIGAALQVRANVADEGAFSLRSYLASGLTIDNTQLGAVSTAIVGAIVDTMHAAASPVAKVLVTDLDNTLWSGIIGDDGVEGIFYRPEGKGYRHFIYQTALRRLRESGVLLAVVSKNDEQPALAPFAAGDMVLERSDFVAFIASWEAKSAQIRSLAEQLNLGLDAFVFVDDNPVELAEVERELPTVHRLLFPSSEKALPTLISELTRLFARAAITDEDRARTELYQRRLQSAVPSAVSGGDVYGFLRELDMTLTIRDRSTGDRTRAIQLINKTNQFNLNGRRLDESEVSAQLEAGSRLLTATLSDRTGSHGEVLAALIDSAGCITSMVMSCRVFQRRVEFAFLAWVAARAPLVRSADYVETDRNAPVGRFVSELDAGRAEDGRLRIDAAAVVERFSRDVALFSIVADEGVSG
jgi:FkbH-like protein